MIITGEIVTVIYQNEENHYHILVVDTGEEEVTVTGTFTKLAMDMQYEFHVVEKEHALYGKQYQAEAYKLLLPSGSNKIKDFLASGLFEGIGESIAERIVAKFGEDTLDIMRYNPDRLKEISGIGDSKFEKIHASFQSHLEAEEILFFLNQLGLSVKQSFKIYEAYGTHTIEKLKRNPYYILKDVKRIGFKTVDEIAKKLGFDDHAAERIESIIVYLLDQEAMNGHMFLGRAELLRLLRSMANVPEDLFDVAVTDLAVRGDIHVEKVESEIRIYAMNMHKTEIGIIREIARLQHGMPKDLSYKGNFSKLDLTMEQQIAVDQAFMEPMYILTGGPGTGKTTILKELVLRMEASEIKYALAAPTGRAASRMEEVIERPASTIHRLLEYMYQEDTSFLHFQRNYENPLEVDAIVVDEVSMMDAPLFLKLLDAAKTGTRIILIGDVNQLPAVGPGNILRDLIDSGVIPTSELSQIHRQAAGSLILTNAHAILHDGELGVNQKGKDFFFIQESRQNKILDTLLDVISMRLPKYYGIDPIESVTVLTPIRSGALGAEGLNIALQARLNPQKGEKVFGRFLVGDKVMQNRNNYSIKWTRIGTLEDGDGVFNGEIGKVETADKRGMVVVFSDGKRVEYSKELSDDLVLAYAMTIHKSQGNEFDYVIIPMFHMPEPLKLDNPQSSITNHQSIFSYRPTSPNRLIIVSSNSSIVVKILAFAL